jgi:hypothetical protein
MTGHRERPAAGMQAIAVMLIGSRRVWATRCVAWTASGGLYAASCGGLREDVIVWSWRTGRASAG